mgnify:CR=1 FL=1
MNINDQKRLKKIINRLYNLKLEKGMQVSIEEIKECLGNEDYEFMQNVLENKNDKKNNKTKKNTFYLFNQQPQSVKKMLFFLPINLNR